MSGKKPKNDRRMPANRTKDSLQSRSLSEISISSVQLSSFTKQALLGMQKDGNPFSRESQEAIEEFHDFVMNFPSHNGVNLEECAILLQTSTKLFGRQVKEASKSMATLAAFVTNTTAKVSSDDETEEDGKKNRQKIKNDKTTEEEGKSTEDETVNKINSSENGEPLVESDTQLNPLTSDITADPSNLETTTTDTVEGSTMISSDTGVEDTLLHSGDCAELNSNSACDIIQTDVTSVSNESEQSTINGVEGITSDPTTSGDQTEVSSTFTTLHTTSQVILPSVPPKGQKRQAKDTPKDGLSKKRKLNEFLPPPTLMSIFDLDEEMDDLEEFDDFPPILFPEVDLWNGQFDLQADPDKPEKPVTTKLVTSTANNNDSPPENIQNPSVVPDNNNSENVVTNPGISTTPNIDNLLASSVVNGMTLPSTENASEFPVLTPEDQQEIQNCINQLHYLPFTCELSKGELARTFHNTVEHLETIFKKYNLPFNRQLLKAASVVCANMVSSFSNSPTNGFESTLNHEALNSIQEMFSQGSNGLRDETLASLINSEKTILERTKEKSVAESRATIQKRLHDMQRVIVPKYIQMPLILENTPEFFRRVKQFEQKMKKVLADEEKKECFDVSKYEIEVLAATADLESQEDESSFMDDSGDDTNTSSQNSTTLIPDFILDEPPINVHETRILIPGMLSPASTSNSPSSCDQIYGRKWVPLSNVIGSSLRSQRSSSMKKFDRNECARHFYAVLALLSSQNLDMNYDRHFSAESAALVTTKLDHSQDGKYPRGVKIMTSRCPDADKEEIYVTALASKSCNETFRDLISHEMNHLQDQNEKSGRRRSGSLDFDSDEEFVPMTSSMSYSGNLFGGRKKRTN